MNLNSPMMRYFILPMRIALLCLPQVMNACVCDGIDEARVKRLIEKYDYVFIGSAIEVLHFDKSLRTLISNEGDGYSTVLFKVDSMIKGEPNLKQIVIQAGDGSCTQWFRLGEKFVIVGNRIDKLNWSRVKKGDFQSLEEQPPIPGYNHSTQIEGNRKAYRYWKRLAKRHTIVTTDMCTSFRVGTEYADLFLR